MANSETYKNLNRKEQLNIKNLRKKMQKSGIVNMPLLQHFFSLSICCNNADYVIRELTNSII